MGAAPNPGSVRLGGYEMLVRGDVLRGKFRNGISAPQPFVPGVVTPLKFKLKDVFHTVQARAPADGAGTE